MILCDNTTLFDPGSDVSVPADWKGYTGVLKKVFPDEAEGLDRFRSICSEVAGQALELRDMFRQSSFKNFFTKMMVPVCPNTLFSWRNKTAKDLMDECFKSDKLKAHVSQLWCYFGLPNDELSAPLFMLVMDMEVLKKLKKPYMARTIDKKAELKVLLF